MSESGLTRRAFSGLVAATAGSAVAGAAGITMAESESAGAAQPAEPPEGAQPVPPPAPADLLLAALLEQYPGEHLTDEMRAGIRDGLRNNLAESERLRAFPLDNFDAPAVIFRAYRKE